ncbi:MAG TPA: acetate--CoA ligase family protein [Candidatus Nanoarchaeia archaeon]|nr:acetate--CoA ligase family protein [Candidatus Nanoarchaeia archaeon]
MILTVDESLKRLNIPVAGYHVASSLKQVERFAKSFGYPVVLKLISPKAIHKTEAGGVKIVHQPSELVETAKVFLEKGSVLVQEHTSGVEMFLGIKNDSSFGHVLLAGIGGIFVEVYKDISFRVCPITRKDAESMLDELKGNVLLKGVRGQKPVNRKALVDAMVALSELPKKLPKIEELDVNPFFVNEKEGLAVDARLVLK